MRRCEHGTSGYKPNAQTLALPTLFLNIILSLHRGHVLTQAIVLAGWCPSPGVYIILYYYDLLLNRCGKPWPSTARSLVIFNQNFATLDKGISAALQSAKEVLWCPRDVCSSVIRLFYGLRWNYFRCCNNPRNYLDTKFCIN